MWTPLWLGMYWFVSARYGVRILVKGKQPALDYIPSSQLAISYQDDEHVSRDMPSVLTTLENCLLISVEYSKYSNDLIHLLLDILVIFLLQKWRIGYIYLIN